MRTPKRRLCEQAEGRTASDALNAAKVDEKHAAAPAATLQHNVLGLDVSAGARRREGRHDVG